MNSDNNLFTDKNNNQIIVIENNKERLLSSNEVIPGLTIEMSGKNNIIKIELPFAANDSFLKIRSDNVQVYLGSTRVFNKVDILIHHGENQYLKIGKDTTMHDDFISLTEDGKLIIGENNMFAGKVNIIHPDGHSVIDKNTNEILNRYTSPLVIGSNCWIGEGVLILKKANIPDYTIVAAQSVLCKCFHEKYTTIAGNPAKVVKKNVVWDIRTLLEREKTERRNKIMDKEMILEQNTKINTIKKVEKVFAENVIPITFSASNYFAPYLGVTIKSIVDKSDDSYNYDLVVFTKDMSDFNKQILTKLCEKSNFSIRFVNVKEIFDNLNLYTPAHITIETYFRLIIPKFMSNYNKILFLDSDLLICDDVKNLYNYDITGYAIAATEECLMSALVGINGQFVIDYMHERLKLKDVDKYFQAGVMLINIDYFNTNDCSSKLMNMVCNFNYNIVDQDAMNELLNDKCFWLPNEWNYPPLQKHMKAMKYLDNMSDFIRDKYLAVKQPKIIHFADFSKPWFDPSEDYAPLWWSVARNTPYYELILSNMIDKKFEKYNITNISFIKNVKKYRLNCLKYWKYKFFKNLMLRRQTREKYKYKQSLYKDKIRQVKNAFRTF